VLQHFVDNLALINNQASLMPSYSEEFDVALGQTSPWDSNGTTDT
jgi:hypothetical protein